MRRLAILMLASALGTLPVACAGPGELTKPAPAAIATQDDKFLPYQEITTPFVDTKVSPTETRRTMLLARRDRKTGTATTHAFLTLVYASQTNHRYETARNARAEALPFRQLQDVGRDCRRKALCAHGEVFLVDVPETDLRRALAGGEGYPIKLFARAGETSLFTVTREQIETLMRELDRPRAAPVASAARR